MAFRYSYKLKLEQRNNTKKLIKYIVLILILTAFLAFLGFPTLLKFINISYNLKKSSQVPVNAEDTTPPITPKFDSFRNNTNNDKFELKGSGEPGSTIVLKFNTKENDVIADNNGRFSLIMNLNNGTNTFSAYSSDQSGNKSISTQEYQVILDKEPPKIDIQTPTDKSEFFGSKDRQVAFQGKTESEATLKANDRLITVNDDGSFSYLTTLNEGENKFTFISEDKAGNQSEKEMILYFTK